MPRQAEVQRLLSRIAILSSNNLPHYSAGRSRRVHGNDIYYTLQLTRRSTEWLMPFIRFHNLRKNLIFKSHSLKSPERPRTNPWQQGIGWDWEKGIPRMGKSNGKTTLMPKPTLCPESCCCLMSCDKFGNDKTHHDEKCSTPRVSWIIDIFSPISLFVFWHFFFWLPVSVVIIEFCTVLNWNGSVWKKKKLISAGYLNHPHTNMHVSGRAAKLKMKI